MAPVKRFGALSTTLKLLTLWKVPFWKKSITTAWNVSFGYMFLRYFSHLRQFFLLFFSKTVLLKESGSIFQSLIYTSLKKGRYENQSCLEFSGDTESESERFQFGHATYPKLSQSNLQDRQLLPRAIQLLKFICSLLSTPYYQLLQPAIFPHFCTHYCSIKYFSSGTRNVFNKMVCPSVGIFFLGLRQKRKISYFIES